MKVFICYASEQRDLAQRIALALEAIGIDVFFDREDLPPGGEFNLAIREAIQGSDLFLFIASKEALQAGSYSVTELGIAQRRWPQPARRVLTLLADKTPFAKLPPYLSAVTVLEPAGDPVAETVDAVVHWRERNRSGWLTRGAVVAAVVAVLAGFLLWLLGPAAPGSESAVEDGTAEVAPDVENAHVYTLKNAQRVRLAGSILKNESNVSAVILRKYVEWDAWRYNRCYDMSFGHLASGLPEGNVDISFEIRDKLPRDANVEHSDFEQAEFGSCVEAVLLEQTLNAAGSDGAGKVVYRFGFAPN